MGRFMSPDDDSDQEPGDPQSWNLYAYVRNNPLNRTDPDGHNCIYQDNDSGKITGFSRGDCDNSTEEKANSGNYVPGTVDTSSVSYDSKSQSLNYSYTGYDGSTGVGIVDRLICFNVYPLSSSKAVKDLFVEYDRALARTLGVSIYDPADEDAPGYKVSSVLSVYWWDDSSWDFETGELVSEPRA
jgi:hypothetical protein